MCVMYLNLKTKAYYLLSFFSGSIERFKIYINKSIPVDFMSLFQLSIHQDKLGQKYPCPIIIQYKAGDKWVDLDDEYNNKGAYLLNILLTFLLVV